MEFEPYFISTASKLIKDSDSEKEKNRVGNNQGGGAAAGGWVYLPNKNNGPPSSPLLYQNNDSSHFQGARRSRLISSPSSNSLSASTAGEYHPALERLLSLPSRNVYNMVWKVCRDTRNMRLLVFISSAYDIYILCLFMVTFIGFNYVIT